VDAFQTVLGYWICLSPVWAVIGAAIGSQKGQAFSAGFLCLLFGPLGVVIALVSPSRYICQNCGGSLTGKFPTCKFCRANLEWDGDKGMPVASESGPAVPVPRAAPAPPRIRPADRRTDFAQLLKPSFADWSERTQQWKKSLLIAVAVAVGIAWRSTADAAPWSASNWLHWGLTGALAGCLFALLVPLWPQWKHTKAAVAASLLLLCGLLNAFEVHRQRHSNDEIEFLFVWPRWSVAGQGWGYSRSLKGVPIYSSGPIDREMRRNGAWIYRIPGAAEQTVMFLDDQPVSQPGP